MIVVWNVSDVSDVGECDLRFTITANKKRYVLSIFYLYRFPS